MQYEKNNIIVRDIESNTVVKYHDNDNAINS